MTERIFEWFLQFVYRRRHLQRYCARLADSMKCTLAIPIKIIASLIVIREREPLTNMFIISAAFFWAESIVTILYK